MRILLLGAGGMLGRELAAQAPDAWELIAYRRSDLDVTSTPDIAAHLDRLNPAWVVNASAFTDVDGAEREPGTAMAVNARAVGDIARLCAERGCALLHFSTDYVFDGLRGDYYTETDEPNPINAYGASKLAGERLARECGSEHVIVRTQWLFGAGGKSFVGTIAQKARAGLPARVADDQFGCCTYTVDLARVTWRILGDDLRGIYHVANRGRVSRFMIAQRIYGALRASELVTPCPSSEFATAARRPASTPLDVTKVENALGIRMASWTDAVDRYLASSASASAAVRQ